MYGCGKSLQNQDSILILIQFDQNHFASDENYSTTPPPCEKPSWKGDGYCDDMNNVASCDYDGGDCCGDNVDTSYCTQCLCLDPAFSTSSTSNTPTTSTNPT